MISDAQVEYYRENGFIVVPDVLSAEEVAELRRVTEGFVEQSREVSEHTPLYDLEDGHAADAPKVRRLKTPHAFHDAYGDMVRHPRIVEVLVRLIGPNVRFQTSKLNMKAAAGGAPVEWHQDWAFYPHTNDDLLAVGIMIDEMTLENGALRIVPGSHRGPTYDHHAQGSFCGAINDAAADPIYCAAVPLTGTAGSITVHHVRAVHGSLPNLSSGNRRFLLQQYSAADAWPLMVLPEIEEYDAAMVAGMPSIEARLAPAPVRMPLPPARHEGSIYENQRGSRISILGHVEERDAPALAETG